MQQLDYDAAARYALGRLERELDPRLRYHSLAHTRDDVLPAAERLAGLTGLDGEGQLLLRTAALFHDLGFVIGRTEHEATGAAIAAGALPAFGYTPAQVAQVSAIIQATRLPQSPQTLLEQLLADADLDLLGRPDFLTRNSELRAELRAFGTTLTNRAWFRDQAAFLGDHHYWTAAARAIRDAGKAKNLALLLEQLATASDE